MAYPPGDVTVGRDAIRALWEAVLAKAPRFEQESPLPTFIRGDINAHVHPPKDGAGARAQVARRQPDGTWLRLLDQPELVPTVCRYDRSLFADTELTEFIGVPNVADPSGGGGRGRCHSGRGRRASGDQAQGTRDERGARRVRAAARPPGTVVPSDGCGHDAGALSARWRLGVRRPRHPRLAPVVALPQPRMSRCARTDYRRAPEHPWPAAVDDAVDALQWIATHPAELEMRPSAVAIAGDSAGGTTAALACLRVRDEAPEAAPDAQLLIYANTDLGNSGGSMHEEGHGYGLDVADIEWFNSQWVPDPAMLTDPRVSPLYAPDLAGVPAAIVITCEHDPLRDQAEAYAERLRQAGVATTVRREQGMVHNFMLWDTISPACAAAADRVAADLAAALKPATPSDPHCRVVVTPSRKTVVRRRGATRSGPRYVPRGETALVAGQRGWRPSPMCTGLRPLGRGARRRAGRCATRVPRHDATSGRRPRHGAQQPIRRSGARMSAVNPVSQTAR